MLQFLWNSWDLLGKYLDYATFLFGAATLLLSRNRSNLREFIFCLTASFTINSALKIIFRIPISAEINPNTFSFPSENEQFSVVFFFGLLYYLFLHNQSYSNKKKLIAVIIWLSASVGFNIFNAYFLVQQGYHTAQDVIGGFISGLIYVLCFSRLFSYNKNGNFIFCLAVIASNLALFLTYKTFFNKLPIHLIKISLFLSLYSLLEYRKNKF